MKALQIRLTFNPVGMISASQQSVRNSRCEDARSYVDWSRLNFFLSLRRSSFGVVVGPFREDPLSDTAWTSLVLWASAGGRAGLELELALGLTLAPEPAGTFPTPSVMVVAIVVEVGGGLWSELVMVVVGVIWLVAGGAWLPLVTVGVVKGRLVPLGVEVVPTGESVQLRNGH